MYLLDKVKSASSAIRGVADMALANVFSDSVAPPVDLHGKRALITGSNIGIGLGIARSLAAQGAETYLLCRNAEKAEKAKEEIQASTGNTAVFVEVVDLERLESVQALVERWSRRGEEGQKIDILVLNAGKQHRPILWWELPSLFLPS